MINMAKLDTFERGSKYTDILGVILCLVWFAFIAVGNVCIAILLVYLWYWIWS